MSFEHWIIDVMSGRARGLGAAAARTALALTEPAYAIAAARRNRRFDDGTRQTHRLPRPVVSVGNITTGGTGKTPAVQWLVRSLQQRGYSPGVLLRGYKKTSADVSSDEESLLRDSLRVPVAADADRFRGGTAMLSANPEVNVLVLDDGFQHRRLARDVDVVLIDATNPFGFGHVLPRGLLREPLAGLARADLVWITRANQVEPRRIEAIMATIREHNTHAPIAQASHSPAALVLGENRLSVDALAGMKAFALSGIGNPAAFEHSLGEVKFTIVGNHRFADHHAFTAADVREVLAAAKRASATHIVTTEKDWVKLSAIPDVQTAELPIVRLAIELALDQPDATIDFIESRLTQRK